MVTYGSHKPVGISAFKAAVNPLMHSTQGLLGGNSPSNSLPLEARWVASLQSLRRQGKDSAIPAGFQRRVISYV